MMSRLGWTIAAFTVAGAIVGGRLWLGNLEKRQAEVRTPLSRPATTQPDDDDDDWQVGLQTTPATQAQVLRLWPGRAPGAIADTPADTPVLQVFAPAASNATRSAMIVMAGGAYRGYTAKESSPVARWLAEQGIHAYLLRFRCSPRYQHPAQMTDAMRAIRLLRAQASRRGIEPDRIGVIGFSAGGHLASVTANLWTEGDAAATDPIERVSSRPDLQVLIYPVISMQAGWSRWTRLALLGENPSTELVDLMSTHLQVKATTPPAFIVHAANDRLATVQNSDLYTSALKAVGVRHQYLRLTAGGHGLGLRGGWTEPCLQWLREVGFLRGPTTRQPEG